MRSILVTGASTGIGRVITETLAQNNFYVYAGARKQEDLNDLDQLENVRAIKLDVNNQNQIESAVNFVKSQGRGLFGLVNNAGIVGIQPLIEVSEDDFDLLLQTNLYGPFRVTKAFSSLLIESKGRIINIGSILGTLSSSFLGPYSMSKHAIGAFTDCLAIELAEFDVSISIIEPGDFDSKISENFLKRMRQDPSEYLRTKFLWLKEYFAKILEDGYAFPQFPHPLPVAESVLSALSSSNPKMRYLVVPDQDQAEMTIKKALKELVQLNYNHEYSYTRGELIGMLDEVLFDIE